MKTKNLFSFQTVAMSLFLVVAFCQPDKTIAQQTVDVRKVISANCQNGHLFPDTWTALNGYNSKTCLNEGCNATFFEIPNGELTLVVEAYDGTKYAFPQNINPVYTAKGEDSEVKFGENGVCAIPASWVKCISTEWNHNLKKEIENPDHTWYNTCTVEGCTEQEGHWIKINRKRVDLIEADELKIGNLNLSDEDGYDCNVIYKADVLTYKRSVNSQWATLCLPFDVMIEGQNFRAFTLLASTNNGIELKEEEIQINAGTPVLIKMNEGEKELSFSVKGQTILPTIQAGSNTNDGKYELVGLYKAKLFDKNIDNNCYIMKDDKLMNPAKILENSSTTSVGSRPFRAYIQDNTQQTFQVAQMLHIGIGGETTFIGEQKVSDDAKTEYYDIQGHRLVTIQR